MELGYKLWYHTLVDPHSVAGRSFHIVSFFLHYKLYDVSYVLYVLSRICKTIIVIQVDLHKDIIFREMSM